MKAITTGAQGRGRPGCTLAAAAALCACLVPDAHAQQGGTAPMLAYDARTRGPVPIPPSERALQAVVAEP
jgi:lactonase